MVIRNYFPGFMSFFIIFFLFSNNVFPMKNALKEISANAKVFVQQNKKKTAVFMFPVSFCILLLLLRELPHKCPSRTLWSYKSYKLFDKNKKIIIFLHGIGANGDRLVNALNNDTVLYEKLPDYNIISIVFNETKVNKALRTSFGQKADMDQVFYFIKNCHDLKNANPENITFIAHSRSGQTLLNCINHVLNKEYDNENIKNILVNSRKIYVAPLLCLKTTIKDIIKKAYVPNKIAYMLSNFVCKFCLPFVTKKLYDPTFVSAIENMKLWNKEHFKNSKIFLPQHDELVGNGKTGELTDILYKEKKSDIMHFVENATHDSDNLLQAAFEEAFKQ